MIQTGVFLYTIHKQLNWSIFRDWYAERFCRGVKKYNKMSMVRLNSKEEVNFCMTIAFTHSAYDWQTIDSKVEVNFSGSKVVSRVVRKRYAEWRGIGGWKSFIFR
jgi:hypothetical protein